MISELYSSLLLPFVAWMRLKTKTVLVLLSLLMTIGVMAGSLGAQPPNGDLSSLLNKQPMPDKAAMSAAKQLFDELFGERIKQAKDRDTRQALAKEFESVARNSKDDPAAYLIILENAMRLHALGGDANESMRLIDQLESEFDVDLYVRRRQAFTAIGRATVTKNDRVALAEKALEFAALALEHEDTKGCKEVLQLGLSASQKARETDLSRRLVDKRKSVVAIEQELAKAAPILAALKANPNDPNANLEAGRVRFALKQWSLGLDCFAKCSDATLAELAKQDQANPNEPDIQVIVGDGWYQRGKASEGSLATAFMERAKHWYELALPSLDGFSKVRATSRVREIHGDKAPANSLNPTPVDSVLFTCGDNHRVMAWDVKTGALVREYLGHTGDVRGIDCSADGKLIASASADNQVKVFDRESGNAKATFRNVRDAISVAFSPDQTKLVFGDSSGGVHLCDIATQRIERQLIPSGGGYCYSVQWQSAPGQVVAGIGARIKVFNAVSGGVSELRGHTGEIRDLAVSQNGRLLVSGSSDRTVRTWNMANGQQVGSVQAHSSAVTSLAFAPNGRYMITGSDDRTAKIWEVVSGRLIHTLQGHNSYVIGVAFSPSGKLVATASWDGTAIIWDAQTGKPIHHLRGHNDRVRDLQFAPK